MLAVVETCVVVGLGRGRARVRRGTVATFRIYCAGNFTGAPELSRCISNRCGAFDGRVHVWDAAAREWLLPRVAALSESKVAADALRAMIKRMLAPDPSKRPTFPELLEELT